MPAATELASFLVPPVKLQIQAVLYNNTYDSIERSVLSFVRSADLAIDAGVCESVVLRLGDSSLLPCLGDQELEALRRHAAGVFSIEYVWFGANLGSAEGQNRLAALAEADFILVQNPDVVACPRLLQHLLAPFATPGVGMTEAKQLPIEHPKDYDAVTGEVGWATMACAMIPLALFRELGCLDADSFFMYCDDVDFSWRLRAAGYKILFMPSAPVFHDKRLSDEGGWQPSVAEQYYSVEAALFLAHKWSRPDLVETHLAWIAAHGSTLQRKAAVRFRTRSEDGSLPACLDAEHRVGMFVDGNYAHHRFPL